MKILHIIFLISFIVVFLTNMIVVFIRDIVVGEYKNLKTNNIFLTIFNYTKYISGIILFLTFVLIIICYWYYGIGFVFGIFK